MKVLTIVAHPREDSLTFQVLQSFTKGLEDQGHVVEVLDLYRENFNPVLHEVDEPDWESREYRYSDEVHQEIERLQKHDGLAFVFPVWWYSIPVIIKGYIDRVCNYGVAYGYNKLSHQKALWIGLAGGTKEHFQKYEYDTMIERHLNVSIANYTGIRDSRVELLYSTLSGKMNLQDYQTIAYELGKNYANESL